MEADSDRYHDCAQIVLALQNVVELISTWCRDNVEFIRKLWVTGLYSQKREQPKLPPPGISG